MAVEKLNGSEENERACAPEQTDEAPIVIVPAEEDYSETPNAPRKSALERLVAAQPAQERGREIKKSDLSFGQRIANFFYHNKIKLIVIAAIVVMVGGLTLASLKPQSDLGVAIYTSSVSMSDYQGRYLSEKLTTYADDINGDDFTLIDCESYNLHSDEISVKAKAIAAFNNQASGSYEVTLFLIDRATFDQLGTVAEDMFEGYKGCPLWVPVDGTGFGEMLKKECFIDIGSLGLCLRRRPQKDSGRAMANYENALTVLNRLDAEYPDLFTAR